MSNVTEINNLIVAREPNYQTYLGHSSFPIFLSNVQCVDILLIVRIYVPLIFLDIQS